MTASSDVGSAQPELLVPPVPAPAPDVKGPGQSSQLLTWLGVAPFFMFALLFLILPTGFLMVGAFQDPQGHFTLANFLDLFQPGVLDAYWISFKVSAASAIGGAVIGSLLAWAAVQGRLPGWIRPTLMTFSGVASNFAGVPLAFAFICTLGRVGLVTVLLKKYVGINLYSTGFSILSFIGPDGDVSVLPDSADGADRHAGARRSEARMARGLRLPRRHVLPVLALCRVAGAVAERAGRDACCCSPIRSARSQRPMR